MKPTYYFFYCMVLVFGCKKGDVSLKDVFTEFTLAPKTAKADGQTTITATVKINPDADTDKRSVIFTATGGVFSGATEATITKDAEFMNGELIAKAEWKVPAKAGTYTISVKPKPPSPYQDFIAMDSITLDPSVAHTIALTASAFSVPAAFAGEITVTGILKNDNKKNVSSGQTVRFEDFYDSGDPVGGSYRQQQATSGDNSTVSTIYTPGNVPVGSRIYIRCTVLDENAQPTTIKDSVFIQVITPP